MTSDQEVVVGRIGRIDIPRQPVRIAQAVRPDLLARAGFRGKWIVIRNPVAAVFADRAVVDVLLQVGNDAQDFADEHIETLRIIANFRLLLSVAAIAGGDVEHAPVRLSRRAVGLKIRSPIG